MKKPFLLLLAMAGILVCRGSALAGGGERASTVAERIFALSGSTTLSSNSVSAVAPAGTNTPGTFTPSYTDLLQYRLRQKLEADANAILGISFNGNPNLLTLDTPQNTDLVLPPGGSLLHVVVSLENTSAHPAAEQFMCKVVGVLPSVVEGLDKDMRAGLQPSLTSLSDARDKLLDKIKAVKASQQDVRDQLADDGMIDSNPVDIHALSQKLDEQREEATIERAATIARRDALTKAVADLTAQLAKKSGNDEIASEMEKVVAVKESRLKMVQSAYEKGLAASKSEVSSAQADVAEARLRLLERRETVARTAGGDALLALQTELQTLQVNAAEADARQIAMQDMAKTLSDAQELGNKLSSLQQDETGLESDLATLKSQVDQLQGQMDGIAHEVKSLDVN